MLLIRAHSLIAVFGGLLLLAGCLSHPFCLISHPLSLVFICCSITSSFVYSPCRSGKIYSSKQYLTISLPLGQDETIRLV